ncbi:MAG: hypothetical protein RLZZ366_1677 [Pseudomonadota bacterium]|jgi:hypothetical protein
MTGSTVGVGVCTGAATGGGATVGVGAAGAVIDAGNIDTGSGLVGGFAMGLASAGDAIAMPSTKAPLLARKAFILAIVLLRQPFFKPLDRIIAVDHIRLHQQRLLQRYVGFDTVHNHFLKRATHPHHTAFARPAIDN